MMMDVMALARARLEPEGLEPKPGASCSFSHSPVTFAALAGGGAGARRSGAAAECKFWLLPSMMAFATLGRAGQEQEKLEPEPGVG